MLEPVHCAPSAENLGVGCTHACNHLEHTYVGVGIGGGGALGAGVAERFRPTLCVDFSSNFVRSASCIYHTLPELARHDYPNSMGPSHTFSTHNGTSHASR